MKVLAINPGSTSTKIAVFDNDKVVFLKNIKHTVEELCGFKKIADQFEYRKNIIHEELKKTGIDLTDIRVVVGRGGMMKPIQSGVYRVNEKMKADLTDSSGRQHASNLGALIAESMAREFGHTEAIIADPVVVDELENIARVSGHPLFHRISIFHALNHKAIARIYAKNINKKYEDLNLIVVHMGGGISIGAHLKGRVIDVNQALDGEGPFSPERSGTLPPGDLVRLCFSGEYSCEEVLKMIAGKGGLTAYLGTNDGQVIQEMIDSGNEKAKELFHVLAYQVAKQIGAASAVLKGKTDCILITGGLAHNEYLVGLIRERVHKISEVNVYPGEDEMKALALNGLLFLNGEIQPKEYT